MKDNEINGLAELRRRREELRLEMKITRQGLFQSLRQTRRETKRAFINGVLIPLGIGSLASLVFNKQTEEGKKPDWLLFAEQAVNTVGQFFEKTEPQNGQPEETASSD